MLNRRGLSLVEVLVAIVILGLVGLATARVLQGMLNTTTAQMAVATNQGMVRTGMLALPQELREIGYDTIPYGPGGTISDLEAIAPHRLTFRAMRGIGFTCGTPTLTEFRIRAPAAGVRDPLPTDGFLLFVESDPNLAADDQWVSMAVVAMDFNSTCGADSAIAFTLAAAPVVDPFTPATLSLSQYRVGGAIRWFERLEYGPYVDGGTGLAHIGVRSLSLGDASLSPIIGPLPDTTAFLLEYYDAAGTLLDPTVAPPISVRSIGIRISGTTSRPVSLAGSTKRGRSVATAGTQVALRNTLRP
jgi:prepilin-type N-terminal cleavage/methylation domain-containing protein